MSLTGLSTIDLIGALFGFILTIFIFSYIWGDNLLFRFATHVFIGAAAGYAVIVAFNQVFLPMVHSILEGNLTLSTILVLVASIFLLLKLSPQSARYGNWVAAFLVGVGAAAAIGGAVTGTIFPQTGASINLFDFSGTRTIGANLMLFINGLIILAGTLSVLIYFQFGIGKEEDKDSVRTMVMDVIGLIGKGFITVTFAAIFAGVYISTLVAMVERLSFLRNFITDVVLSGFN